jgi:hypothetical protein
MSSGIHDRMVSSSLVTVSSSFVPTFDESKSGTTKDCTSTTAAFYTHVPQYVPRVLLYAIMMPKQSTFFVVSLLSALALTPTALAQDPWSV